MIVRIYSNTDDALNPTALGNIVTKSFDVSTRGTKLGVKGGDLGLNPLADAEILQIVHDLNPNLDEPKVVGRKVAKTKMVPDQELAPKKVYVDFSKTAFILRK